LNAVLHVLRGPVPQDVGTPLLLQQQILNLSTISIAVLESISLTRRARTARVIGGLDSSDIFFNSDYKHFLA
jgi:hypothetical protein